MSAHHTPEEIRKGLTHPVIDGDGHWVEYTPVFAEKIRKVTGDLGANGFLQSQRRAPAHPARQGHPRRPRPLCPELRSARPRQRARLRPAVAEVPRARHRADLPYRRSLLW